VYSIVAYLVLFGFLAGLSIRFAAYLGRAESTTATDRIPCEINRLCAPLRAPGQADVIFYPAFYGSDATAWCLGLVGVSGAVLGWTAIVVLRRRKGEINQLRENYAGDLAVLGSEDPMPERREVVLRQAWWWQRLARLPARIDALLGGFAVMVLDDGGAIRPSEWAYDKRVAGVISGAGSLRPGIVLDRRHDGTPRAAIALIGKAFCKVDARVSPIEVGDMLTTSATPGHAMKADDSTRAFGAVIGKALGGLAVGQGMIPVLIALQ
jgi:hypothetical protein